MPLVRRGPGLVRTAVVAGTATAVSGRVARRQQQRWAEQGVPAESQATPASTAPERAPTGVDYTAELNQLAQLHAQGVLTDEEFAAKKAQILGI